MQRVVGLYWLQRLRLAILRVYQKYVQLPIYSSIQLLDESNMWRGRIVYVFAGEKVR